MDNDLNTVKEKPGSSRSYHHGALRSALMDATAELIEEVGVEGFSLREVARRTGVSPAAPAHHFSDARGLLTAVATQSFLALGDALEASEAPGGDREARLLAQFEAYLVFALNSRGRYLLMWRKTILDPEQAELVAAAGRAFAMLDRRFEAARESRSGRATRHKPPLLRAGPWCMAWHC
jgi:AcrR family transcriptional regulator